MLVDLKDMEIKNLSEIYDIESRESFVSLYMNLGGIFVRERGVFMKTENKGRFYHDGRFKTLLDVVNHYDRAFSLGLTNPEKNDLVEYLKSLSSP